METQIHFLIFFFKGLFQVSHLIIENPSKMLPVWKDLALSGQICSSRVNLQIKSRILSPTNIRLSDGINPEKSYQVDARKPVLSRDLLRPQMLLHGHRVVGAAFDGGVIRHYHALTTRREKRSTMSMLVGPDRQLWHRPKRPKGQLLLCGEQQPLLGIGQGGPRKSAAHFERGKQRERVPKCP